jgi:acetyl esterase/lipase
MMPVPTFSALKRGGVAVAAVALCAATGLAANAATSPSVAPSATTSASATPSASTSGLGSYSPSPEPTSTVVPSPTTSSTSTYSVYSNIPYVADATNEQILDLYVPKNTKGRPLPVVMYVHGGGWLSGDKSDVLTSPGLATLLADGFAVASINYTLSSSKVFPQATYDLNASVRYLRYYAGRYHLNGKVGLWGESAGGQLVALAGATCGDSSLEGDEGVSDKVSGCVNAVLDGFGPTDFLQEDTHLYNSSSLLHDPANSPESEFLGCTEGLLACDASTVERANPITYITTSSKLPPYLIVQGNEDTLVPIWESQILYKALDSVCADATFYTIDGYGHGVLESAAMDAPYPSETVQSTDKCSSATSSGPSLNWDGVASFFETTMG